MYVFVLQKSVVFFGEVVSVQLFVGFFFFSKVDIWAYCSPFLPEMLWFAACIFMHIFLCDCLQQMEDTFTAVSNTKAQLMTLLCTG